VSHTFAAASEPERRKTTNDTEAILCEERYYFGLVGIGSVDGEFGARCSDDLLLFSTRELA
jgi:hypothetical protein